MTNVDRSNVSFEIRGRCALFDRRQGSSSVALPGSPELPWLRPRSPRGVHDLGMRRAFADMNPTLRGFLIIAVIAAVIVALSLEQTLTALYLVAGIAFFLAVAFFVYLVWRERRAYIAMWSTRSQAVFYGAAVLIVADLALFFWRGVSGVDALAFFVVLGLCGFSMWRVWRDEHTYSL